MSRHEMDKPMKRFVDETLIGQRKLISIYMSREDFFDVQRHMIHDLEHVIDPPALISGWNATYRDIKLFVTSDQAEGAYLLVHVGGHVERVQVDSPVLAHRKETKCASTCWDKLAQANTQCTREVGHKGTHGDGVMCWEDPIEDNDHAEMVAWATEWLNEADRAGYIGDGDAEDAASKARESLTELLTKVAGIARWETIQTAQKVLRKMVR
jgi:hydrogenase maturation factor